MVNALNDGLNKPDQFDDTGGIGTAEIGSGAVLGANISGGVVLASHLSSGCVLSPFISGAVVLASHQKFVGMGSPSVFGNSIQAGSGTTSAGSVLWVVYGTAFGAAPFVIASQRGDTAVTVALGSVGAGSFLAISQGGASTAFNWIATGSGAL